MPDDTSTATAFGSPRAVPATAIPGVASVAESLRNHRGPRVPFSVEFNPPRDADGEARLWRTVRELERLHPAFVSMTYGAGGSTKDRTARITGELAQQTTLLPVAHLTAVGHSIAELRALVGTYADCGIRNMLVLRGDPPGDPLGAWHKHPDGVEYAEELVRIVRGLGDFRVGVAAFPQGHPRSSGLAADTACLVAKLRAGADYSITQMFFEVDDYLRLRDRVTAADPAEGAKPIIPELMPITSLRTVARAESLSGSALPATLRDRLHRAAGQGSQEDRAAVREAGIEIATEIAQRLIDEGAPCLHFITLNFAKATREVLANLGYDLAPARAIA